MPTASFEGQAPTLLARWSAVVAAAPGRLCVTCGDRALTVAELDDWAEVIASRLHVSGVGVGDAVGILAERHPSTIAGMLAAWKVGAAYVAIDPREPPLRALRQLRLARAGVLLSTREVKCPAYAGVAVVSMASTSVLSVTERGSLRMGMLKVTRCESFAGSGCSSGSVI